MANRGAILLSIFKRRRFPVAIILLCVRWYCKYGISYRDLAEMMFERGVSVNPSTTALSTKDSYFRDKVDPAGLRSPHLASDS
jgi:hypothetical protein